MRTSALCHIGCINFLAVFAKSRSPYLVAVLNGEEATKVLKEIITGCNLSVDAIVLMPPNSDTTDLFLTARNILYSSLIFSNER